MDQKLECKKQAFLLNEAKVYEANEVEITL